MNAIQPKTMSIVPSSRILLIASRMLALLLLHCSIASAFTTSSSSSLRPSLQPLSKYDTVHQSSTISKRPAMTTLWADAFDNRDINNQAGNDQSVGEEGQSRRSFFLTSLPVTIGCVAIAGAGITAAPQINRMGKTTGTSIPLPPPTTIKLNSVGDALTLIEDMCDRKFLHAVVASDYRFLYRGMSLPWEPLPTVVEKEMSDLLLPGTYGEDSLEAVKFFRKLDVAMASKPVRPGVNGHLGTTSTRDAAAWGSPASIWPLSGLSEDNYAHFAFYEDGGAFYPRPKAWSKTAKSVDDGIIVDGINCGAVNLEDALRSKDNEIMFSTESYLAIPSEWDQELREGLRNAFIL